MSLKNADRLYSLRTRLVLLATLTGGLLALLASTLILTVSWHYLMGRTYERIDRMALDLQTEYRTYNGISAPFRHCLEEDAQEHDANKTFLIVSTPGGRELLASDMPARLKERILKSVNRGLLEHRFYTERATPTDRHVAIRLKSRPLYDGNLITVARDVTDVERYLIFLLATLSATTVFMTFGTGLITFFSSTGVVRRLRTVAETAATIEQGDWSPRVPTEGVRAREIRMFIDAFNRMCSQNEKTLTDLRVLTDNIAHDLRTPLTRLALAAEATATDGDAFETLPDRVTAETHAMLEMINTMLAISQTPAQIDRSPRVELDLTRLLREFGDLYEPVAENAGLTLNLNLPERPLFFSGHRAQLQQLVGNLVENALKYTPKGGRVELGLTTEPGHIVLSVQDTGCGIAANDIPHIFKRFWRADSSRALTGNGLGLALVKAIVTSYGGTVSCSSTLGRGSLFTVRLPLD